MNLKGLLISSVLIFSSISSFATVNWKPIDIPNNSGMSFYYDPESITTVDNNGSKLAIGWFLSTFDKPIPLSKETTLPVQSEITRVIMDCETGEYINSFIMFFSEKMPDGKNPPVYSHKYEDADGPRAVKKDSFSYKLLCENKK
jgi:hypothetical protein